MITGDANLSEVATFLKVGTTAFVLAMVEDDVLPRDLRRSRSPVQAMRQVSHDLTLARPLELVDGTTVTALERAVGAASTGPASTPRSTGSTLVGERSRPTVLEHWEAVLTGLETDPMSLADRVDWVAKYRLLEGYRERHDLDWDEPRLAALALQYHDLRPPSRSRRHGSGWSAAHERRRGRARAMTEPPDGHPGLLPGSVPAAVGRPDRGGQLGLARVRRRRGAAPPGADDGTDAWNRGPRRYLLDECATPAELVERAERLRETEGHG